MTATATAIWIVRSLIFLVAAVPTCLFAVRRGGSPERIVAALICLAVIATSLIPPHTWRGVVAPLLVIDAAMLAGLVGVALFADRFWPMYFAAVQLLTVGVHGVRAYDASVLPSVYARLAGELAYLTLAILAIGTWRHVKRGPEADWSWQVGHECRATDAR